MKLWLKNILAFLTLATGVGGTFAYNAFISPALNDTTVVLVNQNLEPNHVIALTDVRLVHVPRTQVASGAYRSLTKVVGKMSAQVISKNQQLTSFDIEKNTLALGSGEFVAPVTSGWIAAISGALRTGDQTDIYVWPKKQGTPSTKDVTTLSNTGRPILSGITIEDLRNGGQEVVNTSGPDVQGGVVGQRQNASAQPNNLDLKLTQPQWDILYQALLQGDQLIFLYHPNK